MNNIELSVVIPAYLEEENLRLLIPRLKRTIEDLSVSFEIMVIDALNPLDNTRSICEENDVKYINREGGNSYGDAVRSGIDRSRGKYVLFMDADGSHSPEFVKELYDEAKDNDAIIASRYVAGGSSDNSAALKFMSYLVNVIYSLVFDLKCKDVSNSFKLYNGNMLRALKLRCSNFDIVEEILIKLKRNNPNIRIKEIPYFFKERMFGHTKRNLLAFMFSYLGTLIKLKFIK